MTDIYIAGIAMTVFGRHPERSLEDLAGEALRGALQDAGCAIRDPGIAYYSGITNGVLQGQTSIPGQVVLSKLGLEDIPIYNVENACASGSSAVNLAVQSLKAGTTDVALAIGAEKMNIADKQKAFTVFDGAWDVARAHENYQMLLRMGEGVAVPPGSESDKPYSRFMAIYAALCRLHMKTFGTSQRQIAAVSAKNHAHSVHNPLSQFRKPFSVDEILAAPPITFPLTLPMCAPLSDGAAAAILCTDEGLQRIGADRSRCVRILTQRERSAPMRCRPSSVHRIAAAAPSESGAHIGSVSGNVIGGAARISSTLKGLRNCDSGLCTECAWFFAETAAIWRCEVPKVFMCRRHSAAYMAMNRL